MFKTIFAGIALLVAGAANAAVFAPSFDGPDLDPGFIVEEPEGFTHTVGFGTVVLSKIQGAGNGFLGRRTSTYSYDFGPAVSEFVAKLTVNTTQLGNTHFEFGIKGTKIQTLFSIQANTYAAFASELFDPGNYSGQIDQLMGNVSNLEIRYSNNTITMLRNNDTIRLVTGADQANTFYFRTVNFLGEEPNYTTAFVSHVSITTPDVCGAAPCTSGTPEPANWALLIAGFGLTGATLRRRRAGKISFA